MALYRLEATTASYTLAGVSTGRLVYVNHLFAATAAFAIAASSASLNVRSFNTLTDTLTTTDTSVFTPVLVLTQGVGIEAVTPTYAYRPGAAIAETVRLLDTASAKATLGVVQTDGVRLTEIAQQLASALVADGLGLHDAAAAAAAAVVIQGLGLNGAVDPKTTYGVALIQALTIRDTLRQFLGGSVVETLNLTDTPIYSFRQPATVAETISLVEALSGSLILRVDHAETIGIDDANALQQVFNGTLTDGIQLTALHVSPNGNVTTWVVNTVNNAITEYTNYSFNSFAQLGHRYIGASKDGLYLLDGNRDGTSNVIADIRSGLFSFAGAQLSGMKGVYLGMRGDGEFFLKLETGDGRTYTYGVTAQPSMVTTKVNTGKGLRARYWRFELLGTGPAFDLESIEFVPMVATRRV